MGMEWSIQEIAKIAGTTSRTLRHYDDIGLVPPSHIGLNGYRYYDQAALVRLQRVLLLRELGLGLPQIRDIVTQHTDEIPALSTHLELLRQDLDRRTRQIAAVEATISSLRQGESLMAQTMFDGFDHTQYKDEVTQRWGADAYRRSDRWWRSMSEDERAAWKREMAQLGTDWITVANDPQITPDSAAAQDVAARHLAWLKSIPGTPAAEGGDLDGYVRGLAQMYIEDERFAANYGGREGAEFVRGALIHHLDASAF